MIRIKREGPKDLPSDFRRRVDDYNRTYGSPEIDIVWNPTSVDLNDGYYDPRWEFWVEVTDNTKQKKTIESEGDVERRGKTWRFLNTWQYPDGSYAPLDDRIFRSLRDADTWKHAETYHEMIEVPERYKQEQEHKALLDTAYAMRTSF